MVTLKLALGFSLLALATFCGQTHAVLPHVAEYRPQVVKPLFDLMREYGSAMKLENKKEMCGKNQFLVVLMASHEEITNPPVKGASPTWRQQFEDIFSERLDWLPNKKKHNFTRWNCKRSLHGEIHFIQNEMVELMLKAFRAKYPHQTPVLLMYSHFIPCADIQGLGYSCSEELGVFATINWSQFGILVAYSESFPGFSNNSGTNIGNAVHFMQLGGIPVFQYQNSSNGEKLVKVTAVGDAGLIDRWRSVTFLPNLFACLEPHTRVREQCLEVRLTPNYVKAVTSIVLNDVAYSCFREKNFYWRIQNKVAITSCFTENLENKIASRTMCAVQKQNMIEYCVLNSFKESLIPGGPEEPFDPLSHTWRVTRDVTLNTIFSQSSIHRIKAVKQKIKCADVSLELKEKCKLKQERSSFSV